MRTQSKEFVGNHSNHSKVSSIPLPQTALFESNFHGDETKQLILSF